MPIKSRACRLKLCSSDAMSTFDLDWSGRTETDQRHSSRTLPPGFLGLLFGVGANRRADDLRAEDADLQESELLCAQSGIREVLQSARRRGRGDVSNAVAFGVAPVPTEPTEL